MIRQFSFYIILGQETFPHQGVLGNYHPRNHRSRRISAPHSDVGGDGAGNRVNISENKPHISELPQTST